MPTRPTTQSPADAPIELAVGEQDSGVRLDKWLSGQVGSLTRTRLKALIEQGALTRNGEVFADPSWRLREGEAYSLALPEVAAPEPLGEAIPIVVVHEDADLIVIDKPAGMVVHPAAGNWSGTLVNALIAHCGASLSGVGGVARPGIVHRLDKDTSGLIVVAKNDAAHLRLSAAFSAHDIERLYEAICVGAPRPSVGTVEAPLARHGSDRKKMGVAKLRPYPDDDEDIELDANGEWDPLPAGARWAVTHYRAIEAYGRSRAKLAGDALASRIECELETGRTHQIRVHMAHIGHPLLGDQVYGRGPGLSGLKPGDPVADAALDVMSGFRRQALHARVLGFEHPATGEALRFEAPAPPDFTRLTAALKEL